MIDGLAQSDSELDRPFIYLGTGTDIIIRLQRIYEHSDRIGPTGYLVAALRGDRPAFVRCTFTGNGSHLMLEAVPGDYQPTAGGVQLGIPLVTSSEIVEGLGKVGFSPSSSGAFLFDYEIDPNPDTSVWGGAMVSILNPLIDVFGATLESDIEIFAPLAPEEDEEAMRAILEA